MSVIQPPGFTAISSTTKASFRVSAPGFIGSNYLLGKDTIAQATVSLPPNVTLPALNVDVTLTSSDPSNVLLSTDLDAAPAPASGALYEVDRGDGHQRDVDANREVVRPIVVRDRAVNVKPFHGIHLREEVQRERANERAAGQRRKPHVTEREGPAHEELIGIDVPRLD